MAGELMDWWNHTLVTKRDTRVDGYFMMDSPVPSFMITGAYFLAVEWGLPKFMQNRKPYEMREFMMVYNFAMVLLSGYTFLEFGMAGWFTGYSLGCQMVDFSNDPKAVRMVNVCWLFYFTKFIELIDTVIFILRKKYNQVTFLHVFHHGIMPVSWWFGVRFVPGGLGTFHALLNSFIHFCMYAYYGLAAMGPQYQKYLWWKKYMTKMQITQFIVVCIHTCQLLLDKSCHYPKMFAYWILSYAFIFLVMFANFYVQAYKTKKTTTKVASNGITTNGTSNGLKRE